MARLLSSVLAEHQPGYIGLWCPGCGESHWLTVGPSHVPGTNWGWNGDVEKPTITPSLLVRSGHYVPGAGKAHCWCNPAPDGKEWGFKCTHCHSFIENGQIRFLNDCSHELAGETVDMVPFPLDWIDA